MRTKNLKGNQINIEMKELGVDTRNKNWTNQLIQLHQSFINHYIYIFFHQGINQ